MALVPGGASPLLRDGQISEAFHGVHGPAQANAAAAAVLHGNPTAVANAAVAIKSMAGDIDTLLHAVGILAALPHVLDDDEQLQSLTVTHEPDKRGRTLPDVDLVTDRQLAEFTFMQWHATKGNGARLSKVVAHLLKLATARPVDGRRRVLYAMEGHRIEQWLGRADTDAAKAAASRKLSVQFGQVGSPATVREMWARVGPGTDANIQIVHLPDVVPGLATFAEDH
jgi:hypothetical protein